MRKFSFFTGLAASVALFTFAGGFMTLLTDKPEIQAIGRVYVFIMGFAQIPQDLAKVYNGTIRSAGYRNMPMMISFIGIWCVRVPISVVFGKLLGWDISFVWIAIALDQIVRILLSIGVFQKKRVIDRVLQGPPAQAQKV